MPNDYVHIDKYTYDASCISSFLLCPKLFELEYVKLIKPEVEPAPLVFGRVIHEALLIWYKEKDAEKAAVWARTHIPDGIEDVRRTKEHGEVIVRDYCKRYPSEPYAIKQSEIEFAIDMPSSPTCTGGEQHDWDSNTQKCKKCWAINRVYVGRIDQIVEWEGGVYVKDHKTTSQLGQNFYRSFRPSIQLDGYAFACRELVGRCDGVVINGISVASNPKERFGRDLQGRTPMELDRWGVQFGKWCAAIEECITNNNFPLYYTACNHWGRCDMWERCVYGKEE